MVIQTRSQSKQTSTLNSKPTINSNQNNNRVIVLKRLYKKRNNDTVFQFSIVHKNNSASQPMDTEINENSNNNQQEHGECNPKKITLDDNHDDNKDEIDNEKDDYDENETSENEQSENEQNEDEQSENEQSEDEESENEQSENDENEESENDENEESENDENEESENEQSEDEEEEEEEDKEEEDKEDEEDEEEKRNVDEDENSIDENELPELVSEEESDSEFEANIEESFKDVFDFLKYKKLERTNEKSNEKSNETLEGKTNEKINNNEQNKKSNDDSDSSLFSLGKLSHRIRQMKQKIASLDIPEPIKQRCMQILSSSGIIEEKRMDWFNALIQIPFNKFEKYEVDVNNIEQTSEFIVNMYELLNHSVWGMMEVKEEILNFATTCLTQPSNRPRVLALCGEPGIGKTKLVRDGVAQALKRPMQCFSMGGMKDSKSFIGFDYTYVGSKHGAIVQALIDCKTMNPILFFDEVDKISKSNEGQEIENVLIHLTDPVQNHDFRDKYFDGIPIDLSKALIIFSVNHIENLSPILRDRLHVIQLPSPTMEDKVNICKRFFIDETMKMYKMKEEEIIFDNNIIKFIIQNYTNEEKGVRALKRCIQSIIMKLNTHKLLGNRISQVPLSSSKMNIKFPLRLNQDLVRLLLKDVLDKKELKCPFMYV